MRITVLILGGFLIIALGSLAFVASNIRDNIEVQYSQASEEPLVDFAHLFAAIVERDIENGTINPTRFRESFSSAYQRDFRATIHNLEKTKIATEIYITDKNGIVIYDSDEGKLEGEDFSRWRDVAKVWQGNYGARSTRLNPRDSKSSVFYVGAPIYYKQQIIGTLSVSRPETAMAPFADESKKLITKWCIFAALGTGLLGAIWVHWILSPIRRLTTHAEEIASGKSQQLPIAGRAELRKLSTALEGMRRELEGKHYVENYVQALTHELKSPLAAIRGAAELIDESMPEDKRRRFLDNILVETARSEDLVRRLVQLASIESQSTLATKEKVNITQILHEVVEDSGPVIESQDVTIELSTPDQSIEIVGDPLMLQIAIQNTLGNAIDFSPTGEKVSIVLRQNDDETIEISIDDEGPGIPEYAENRVFERFYSLKNRQTGRKGSGIGLCFTRESMNLHKGSVALTNRPQGGARALLTFNQP